MPRGDDARAVGREGERVRAHARRGEDVRAARPVRAPDGDARGRSALAGLRRAHAHGDVASVGADREPHAARRVLEHGDGDRLREDPLSDLEGARRRVVAELRHEQRRCERIGRALGRARDARLAERPLRVGAVPERDHGRRRCRGERDGAERGDEAAQSPVAERAGGGRGALEVGLFHALHGGEERARALRAVGGVLREGAREQRGELGRGIMERQGRRRTGIEHRAAPVHHREREPARERLEEHHRGAEHVGACVARRAAELLGRHVRRRPAGEARAIEQVREPEVHDLHTSLVGEEDVAGLQIAVDDAVGVRVREAARDVACEPHGLERRHRASPEPLLERLAAEELQDEEGSALVDAVVVQRDDVRVVEPGGRLRLLAQRLLEDVRARERRAHGLEGDEAAELGVARLEHDAEAAAADLAEELEPADSPARDERRRELAGIAHGRARELHHECRQGLAVAGQLRRGGALRDRTAIHRSRS